MQISRAARWARTGSIIYHWAVPSLKPHLLPGPLQVGLSCGLLSCSLCSVGHSPVLNTAEDARGQVTTLGDPQMKDFSDEMEGSSSLQYCKAGITRLVIPFPDEKPRFRKGLPKITQQVE